MVPSSWGEGTRVVAVRFQVSDSWVRRVKQQRREPGQVVPKTAAPREAYYYVMDRGYVDFAWLFAIQQAQAFFGTRTKKNMAFRRRYSHAVDKTLGVQSDQTIVLANYYAVQDYPEPLRRVRYYEAAQDRRLVFLTNNLTLPAATISSLYKSRWQIELFFKWIKQHLRIKAFYVTSQNAVKMQIWSAVATYLLVAIVKKRLGSELPLYTILQILSLTQFEKVPLIQALATTDSQTSEPDHRNQLWLFG